MRALTVTGGAVAISEMLKDYMEWNEVTPVAIPVHVVDASGRIKTSSWNAFGALKPCVWSCGSIWEKADKSVKIVLRIGDL